MWKNTKIMLKGISNLNTSFIKEEFEVGKIDPHGFVDLLQPDFPHPHIQIDHRYLEFPCC